MSVNFDVEDLEAPATMYQTFASIFSPKNCPRVSDLSLGGFGTGEITVIEVAQTAAIVSVFLQF